MAARKVLFWPDRKLREHSVDVSIEDARELSIDLKDTMKSKLGLGIAAPQVGIHKRLCVIDKESVKSLKEDSMLNGCIVLINPTLSDLSLQKVESVESCLSVPGVVATVARSYEVSLSYSDLSGNTREVVLNAGDACIIQHEVDHLDGKLFIDRLSTIKKSMLLKKIKKANKKRSALFALSKRELSEKKAVATMRKNREKRKKAKRKK